MLGTNPDVMSFGEIFSESNPRSYYSFLQQRVADEPGAVVPSRATDNFMRYMEHCKHQALQTNSSCELLLLGVKYDQAHLVCDPWWKLGQLPKLFFLMRDVPWKVIDIHRRNAARLCISNRIAVATRVYHLNPRTSERPQMAKIRVDPAELGRDIEATQWAYEVVTRHFAGRPEYKRVYYEEMFDSSGEFSRPFIAEISAFLQVRDVFDARPKLKKVLVEDIFNYIENEDEVRQMIERQTAPD
jgi:hypothetical protein